MDEHFNPQRPEKAAAVSAEALKAFDLSAVSFDVDAWLATINALRAAHPEIGDQGFQVEGHKHYALQQLTRVILVEHVVARQSFFSFVAACSWLSDLSVSSRSTGVTTHQLKVKWEGLPQGGYISNGDMILAAIHAGVFVKADGVTGMTRVHRREIRWRPHS